MLTQGDPEGVLPVIYVPSEPPTHSQAMNGQEHEDWMEAERKELKSRRDKNMFTDCKLPPRRRTIRTK